MDCVHLLARCGIPAGAPVYDRLYASIHDTLVRNPSLPFQMANCSHGRLLVASTAD